MRIKYGSVVVRIGAPYNKNIVQAFSVKEGSSYLKQGYALGHIILIEFVEHNFDQPTSKDFRYIESISEIKVHKILP